MNKNKIIANLVFNPFTNDSRVEKTSKSLVNNGYHVEVIAHLNKGLKKEEQKDGYTIRRFSYFDRIVIKDKVGKLKAYLKYVKESVQHCKNFDVLHCNDLNTLPIAFIIKKFYNKNIKVVYDAHEYETEIDGLSGIQKRLTKALEKFLIRYADKVITVSDAIANEYTRLYDIPKPALVLNTPPYKKIEKKDLFREKLGIGKDKTIFLYQGGLSSGRGIEILLETFKQLFAQKPKTKNQKPIIVFMGYGPLEEVIKKASEKYDNIYFYPAVSPDMLLDYTSSADFGILFYENTCQNHNFCSPNKIFEYLMAEIPVIVSNLYEMKRLVEVNAIGVVAKENTPKGLKGAAKEALGLDQNELQKNIQKVKEIYNWEEQERVLIKLYEELEQ